MTSVTDLCNRMLQRIGTRTDVTDAELAANSTNESKQFNLMFSDLRDGLLRLAPWDCGLKTANLTYISSSPGTPENTSPATQLWQPGQPAPPWSYEYQYPVDCLRACWISPVSQTGFAGGIPITTAVTGGAATYWNPGPIKFKVHTDAFCAVTAAAVASGGSGYAVGDVVTLASGPTSSPPIGAPAQLLVTGAPGGVINAVSLINVLNLGTEVAFPGVSESDPVGGSYFAVQTNPVAQGSTTGVGTGATFNLTQSLVQTPQRVILTNQEFATLTYVQQVIDPNVFDPLFRDALIDGGAAIMAPSLREDKKRTEMLIQSVNRSIETARSVDGNEGLTINDVTPDWIRVRGWWADGYMSGPYAGFDWGGLWSPW